MMDLDDEKIDQEFAGIPLTIVEAGEKKVIGTASAKWNGQYFEVHGEITDEKIAEQIDERIYGYSVHSAMATSGDVLDVDEIRALLALS